jgi:hypothetical protein
MALRNRSRRRREVRLTLDARKRISLAKLLPEYSVSSFLARVEGDNIVLEPMAEIPARELWLHSHEKALSDVQEGLKQSKEGRVTSRGSFAEYVQDDF